MSKPNSVLYMHTQAVVFLMLMVCWHSYSGSPGPGDSGIQRTPPGEGSVLCGPALWREKTQPGRGVRKQNTLPTVFDVFHLTKICIPFIYFSKI